MSEEAKKAAEAAATAEAAKKAAEAAATAEAANKTAEAAADKEPAKKAYKEGDKVLVSPAIGDQVNPLTNQRFPHGATTVALYDRWLEIQEEAGVVSFAEL